MTEPQPIQPNQSGSRWQALIWVGLIGLLVIVGISLVRAQRGHVQVGDKAPGFVLTSFTGEEIDSTNLAGKIVVLNFWASWCITCEQEATDLETAWRRYKDRGDVVFIGIDYVDTVKEAQGYLQKYGITYPNGADLGTRISHAYGMSAVPETYFIDRDGVLAYVKIGPFQSVVEITSVIEPLLVEP